MMYFDKDFNCHLKVVGCDYRSSFIAVILLYLAFSCENPVPGTRHACLTEVD